MSPPIEASREARRVACEHDDEKKDLKGGESPDKNIENDSDICIICCERKRDTFIECGHSFCAQCVRNWTINYKNTCPMCNTRTYVYTNRDVNPRTTSNSNNSHRRRLMHDPSAHTHVTENGHIVVTIPSYNPLIPMAHAYIIPRSEEGEEEEEYPGTYNSSNPGENDNGPTDLPWCKMCWVFICLAIVCFLAITI